MSDSGYRYVAHLDILGMSAIVDKDFDDAWTLLSELVAVRDRIGRLELEFTESGECIRAQEAIQMVTFSDTIMLFTKGESPLELRCMIVLLTEIFHKALCRCVPVRAGLAHGVFSFNLDKSMYAGPALIEAYRVGEAAQWLGIALGASIRERAIALAMRSGKSNAVVDWPVPVKRGTAEGLVVNWPAFVAHDLKAKPPISVAQFYAAFERSFGPFEDLPQEVQEKYSNTVTFMNQMLAAHARA